MVSGLHSHQEWKLKEVAHIQHHAGREIQCQVVSTLRPWGVSEARSELFVRTTLIHENDPSFSHFSLPFTQRRSDEWSRPDRQSCFSEYMDSVWVREKRPLQTQISWLEFQGMKGQLITGWDQDDPGTHWPQGTVTLFHHLTVSCSQKLCPIKL